MIRRVGRHRRDRAVLATAAVVILAGGGTAAGLALSSGTAHAEQVATCEAAGGGGTASCTVTATIANPQAIQLQLLSVPPKLTARFTYSNVCTGEPEQDGSGTITSVGLTQVLIQGTPSSCRVTATMTLETTGELNVFLEATVGSPQSSSTNSSGHVTYHTVKGFAGKCLDDAGNSSANRAKVVIWNCSNTDPAQGWSVSGGELKHNGKCLNAKGSGARGSQVMLWSCNGAANEIWSHKSNGEYVLKAGGGKMCLTDPGNSTKNGTQLIVWTCANTASQHWSVP